jgi:predicted AAA+ superfamily ATPase
MNGVQTNGQLAPVEHHIWLVTGPAGCGKSTVAKYLADSLNLPYIEGDEVSHEHLRLQLFGSFLNLRTVSPQGERGKDEQWHSLDRR